jgi:FtsP/CotA-like multicopper oxidase with cupredoxin domain
VPWPVPPVLEPVRSDTHADYYEITQKVGQAEILPGLKTEVWGYNGLFPGPTIESWRSRQTIVRHRNELDVPVVVHLHGGRTPPEHDGYPTDVIMPVGGTGSRRGGAEMNGMTLWTVNGKPFEPDRIDATPELGAVEL